MKPVKLFSDGARQNQPKNTASYVRNAVIYSTEGDFALSNEEGHTELFSFVFDDEEFIPIGSIPIGRETVMFLKSTSNFLHSAPSTNRIILVDRLNNTTTLLGEDVAHESLDFSYHYPIKGVYATNSKGERIIYWVDGINLPRFLNIDNVDADITIDDMSLFLLTKLPRIDVNQVNDTGGVVQTGSYQFAIQLLDEDFAETNFLSFTGQVPVTDELSSVAEYDFDGAQAGTETSKSISLTIGELHGNMRYYRIGVIKTIDNTSSYEKTEILRLPSDLSDFNYTYTGLNMVDSDESEMLKQYASYSTAAAITQLNNRLLLGNLNQFTDLQYQELAAQIDVSWYVEEFDMWDKTKSYKNPVLSANARSEQRDEVVALAVVWTLNDGSESFSYHIPGREKEEGRELSGGVDIMLGYSDPVYGNVEKWKAVSTADTEVVPTGDVVETSSTYYKCGYYEASELYPDTEEWGDLAGTPVRHHRMPNLGQSPHFRRYTSGGTTKYIGRRLRLKVSNVQLPEVLRDKVTGFKIVRVQRNSSNRSVLAQGAVFNYTYRKTEDGKSHVINSFPFSNKTTVTNCDLGANDIENEFSFYSPEYVFGVNDSFTPEYLQQEHILYATSFTGVTVHSNGIPGDSELIVSGKASNYRIIDDAAGSTNRRRSISNVIRVGNNVDNIAIGSSVVLNNKNAPSHVALKVAGDPVDYASDVLTAVGINTGGFPLKAEGTTATNGTISTTTSAPGMSYYLSNMKRRYFDQYSGITSLEYIDTGYTYYFPDEDSKDNYVAGTNHKGINGDVFISNFWFRRTVGGNRDYFGGNGSSDINPDGDYPVQVRAMNWLPIETTVNVDMRHGGEDQGEDNSDWKYKYYPKTQPLFDGDGESVLEKEGFYDNHWAYNTDYSKEADFKTYIPKPINFTESSAYQNRVIFSEEKTEESSYDNFRKFRSSNYKDMPKNRGEITNLINKDNRLLVHCKDALFIVPTDEQRFEVTEGVVNTATGAFLIQTPYELISADNGYYGLSAFSCSLMTPYGYVFVDYERGFAVVLQGKTPEEISSDGKRIFFQNNGRLLLKDALEAADITLRESAMNPHGCGYMLGYDPILRRVIITKRDYTIIPTFRGALDISLVNYNAGELVYTNDKFYRLSTTAYSVPSDVDDIILIGTGGILLYLYEVSVDDTTYFNNEGFTLSYSFDSKGWVSEHDYSPYYMWTTSVLNKAEKSNNQIRALKFGGNDFGVFKKNGAGADVVSPFILEVVFNEGSGHKIYDSFVMDTPARNSDGVLQQKTFTKFLLYNSYQCSGEQNIVNRNGARNVRGLWQVNRFRDLVDDYTEPILINNELNTSNINSSKHWTLRKMFTDNYLVCRLTYNNSDNFRLSLYGIDALSRPVPR